MCVHIQCLHIKSRSKKLDKKLSRLAVVGLMRPTLIVIINIIIIIINISVIISEPDFIITITICLVFLLTGL